MSGFQKPIFAFVLLCAVVATCSGETQSEGGGYIIRAGIGIEECPIRCDEKTFKELFQGTKSGGYLVAPKKGVDALIVRGKVHTLFFYINSPNEFKFHGLTDTGIGVDSSIKDVIQAYGKPEKVISGPVTLTQGKVGEEDSLIFRKQGISFTFIDGRLADIRVQAVPADTDMSAQEKRSKLVGEWSVNWGYSPESSYREAFLRGIVGPVLRFENYGLAVLYIPCDINEKVTKDTKITGTWSVSDNSEIDVRFEVNDAGFKGKLTIDEESEEADLLLVKQNDGSVKRFVRFDQTRFQCN